MTELLILLVAIFALIGAFFVGLFVWDEIESWKGRRQEKREPPEVSHKREPMRLSDLMPLPAGIREVFDWAADEAFVCVGVERYVIEPDLGLPHPPGVRLVRTAEISAAFDEAIRSYLKNADP